MVSKKPLINLKYKQSQSPGFFWENEIREKVFKLTQIKNDVNKYDIKAENNIFDDNENVSIKVSRTYNICCGDICNFYNYDFNCKNTIIYIKYDQIKDIKKIREIYEINYNQEMHKLLFGNIKYKKITNYVDNVKELSNGIISKEIRKNLIITKKYLQTKFNMSININPKIDSNKQRRVQCSIPNIKLFLEKYPEFLISKNNLPIIRENKIIDSIISKKRIRLFKF